MFRSCHRHAVLAGVIVLTAHDVPVEVYTAPLPYAWINGRFILSINDVPEIRAIFDGFHIEAIETTYTISGKGGNTAGELIISNPP